MAQIPVSELLPTCKVNPETVKKYALIKDPFWPGVTYVEDEGGQKLIIDGNHHWFASLLRGEATIEAQPSLLPRNIQENWLDRRFGR